MILGMILSIISTLSMLTLVFFVYKLSIEKNALLEDSKNHQETEDERWRLEGEVSDLEDEKSNLQTELQALKELLEEEESKVIDLENQIYSLEEKIDY